MTGPRLHEHRLRFEETNDFVDFILGLACLTSSTTNGSAPDAPPDGAPAPSPSEDDFIHFVLGLLALMAKLRRLISREARENPQNREAPLAPPFLRYLLR